MLKGLDALNERFLADLSRISERSAKVQKQISSGYRISRSSDDPDQVMNIVQLKSDINRTEVVTKNLERVKAEVGVGEAAIATSISLVERARVLAAQASSDITADRRGLLAEVQQIQAQLVSLTATKSEGRYVFSGDLDQSVLYTYDWNLDGGISRSAVAQNTRQIEDVNGVYFSVSHSAHQIFDIRDADDDPATGNVFYAIKQLGDALDEDDPAKVRTANDSITAALDHLNKEITYYGHLQNRIEYSITSAKTAGVARRQELSAAEDTDITAAVIELQMIDIHQNAAYSAYGRLPKTSLFDYLA